MGFLYFVDTKSGRISVFEIYLYPQLADDSFTDSKVFAKSTKLMSLMYTVCSVVLGITACVLMSQNCILF